MVSHAQLSSLAIAVVMVGAACSEPPSGLVCPLLAPGATATLAEGAPLVPTAEGHVVTGDVGPGALAMHPMWLAAGEKVKVSAAMSGPAEAPMLVITYGPRDVFGGFPFCSKLADGGSATLTADVAGEYLVVIGRPPKADAATYEVTATCTAGCAEARCATLAAQGCADVRCDGELVSVDGCLTCTCDESALCGPDRAAGPGGACILPACDCPDLDEPVCGADGNTYRSACHALCAAVPVAADEACTIACGELACDAPCFGLRALDAEGCPTCTCMGDFAENPESCRACPEANAPVCGSDGVTYRNRCKARCAGARVMLSGACVPGLAWPDGCTLDCAHGLRPVAGTASAFACDCAPAPTLSCPTRGVPICALVPGPVGMTTVPSACAAVSLAATDGVWGSCGVGCESDDDCPDDARCQLTGFFEGRCVMNTTPPCGCSSQLDPVCGVDAQSYDNACLAHCLGVAIAYNGACCAPQDRECAEDEIARLDATGCASDCGAPLSAVCAPEAAITAPSCDLDGLALEGDACAAHFDGVPARPEACP